MRIFVTGSRGFLGQHLCAALRRRGDFVIGLVRDHGRQSHTDCDVEINGSFDQVERAIAEYEVQAVFALAAQTQVSTAVADPVGTFESNVRGTWQVLEACRRQKVNRVIVASSDKVYGDGPSPYFENQPIEAGGVYATSKCCTDLIAQAYAREYGMSVAITRCGNLFGPGHVNFSTLIPGTIRSILRGEPIRLRSDGGPKRDFLYVEDAVDGYLKLGRYVEEDINPVGPFNLGTGRGTTVMEVVDKIQKLMGSNVDIVVERPKDAAVEIDEQVLDWSKAKKLLDWEPKHSLDEGLTKTIGWYRSYLGAK